MTDHNIQVDRDVDVANLSLLKKSINPSSSYDYGITPKMLWTVNSWNIV